MNGQNIGSTEAEEAKGAVRRKETIGENYLSIVERYMDERGFEILERNWEGVGINVGFIAKLDGELHFIDVKHVAPGSALGDLFFDTKQRPLWEASVITYLMSHNEESFSICFDSACVISTDDEFGVLKFEWNVLGK